MISKKTKYGIKAMTYLARRENTEPVRISVISKSENISQKFLESILLTLRKCCAVSFAIVSIILLAKI